MIAAQASPEALDVVMRGLMALSNLDGLLVTSPHKLAACAFADRLSTRAKIVGAINALRRDGDGGWSGDMFDGVGFVRAANRLGGVGAIMGANVRLFGCGGAGAAIAAELADSGAGSIALVDPDETRARDLAQALTQAYPACKTMLGNDGTRKDIVINASVVGMRDDDQLPGDPGILDSRSVVGDVVLRPPGEPTRLIAHALSVGAQVITGQDMHQGQVDALLDFFIRDDAGARPITGER
jgi:shikimate dehydrogenase